jgi:hypothetical protein
VVLYSTRDRRKGDFGLGGASLSVIHPERLSHTPNQLT